MTHVAIAAAALSVGLLVGCTPEPTPGTVTTVSTVTPYPTIVGP